MGQSSEVKKPYRQYYNEQLEAGLEYQDFVADQLYRNGISVGMYTSKKWQIERGENRAGVEIKYDRQFSTTKNFWIELAEKSNPKNADYFPSGIMRDDNSWLYVMGDYQRIFVFPKNVLRLTAVKYPVQVNKTKTSQGFLLPVCKAEVLAAKVIVVSETPTA